MKYQKGPRLTALKYCLFWELTLAFSNENFDFYVKTIFLVFFYKIFVQVYTTTKKKLRGAMRKTKRGKLNKLLSE